MADVDNPFAAFLASRPKGDTACDFSSLNSAASSDVDFPTGTTLVDTTAGVDKAFSSYLSIPKVAPSRSVSTLSTAASSDVPVKRQTSLQKGGIDNLASFLSDWKPKPEQVASLAECFQQDRLCEQDQNNLKTTLLRPPSSLSSVRPPSNISQRSSTLATEPSLQRSLSTTAIPATPSKPSTPPKPSTAATDASPSLLRDTSLPALRTTSAPAGDYIRYSRKFNGSKNSKYRQKHAAGYGLALDKLLPPLDPQSRSMQWTSSVKEPSTLQEIPILQSWHNGKKRWNITFKGKKGEEVKRQNLLSTGDCVVIGDGRMPMLIDRKSNNIGWYFSFKVDGIDDEHFPLETLKDLTSGFGVTRTPPTDKRCEGRVYGYEVPKSIIVGFGSSVIDGGKWKRSTWDARSLRKDDKVSVLITVDGDFVLYVNSRQVLRFPTSIADVDKADLPLYPIVDLHGRISAVTLKEIAPPCHPLKPRDALEVLR